MSRRPFWWGLGLRLIAVLLRLYPRAFREQFGEAMLQDFDERLRERSVRGAGAGMRTVLRTGADVLVCALRERLRPSVVRGAPGKTMDVPRRGRVMDHLRMDLRFALRSLARRPAFTTAAVLTLALGIGANTAIFSVVNGVLLRPLPYVDPERLLMIWSHRDEDPSRRGVMSAPDIASTRDLEVFSAAEGFTGATLTLTGGETPELVDAARVTGGLLAVFGLTPALGRDLLHEENSPSAARVVVLGHDFWQQRLGGRPDVIGTTLELAEQSYEIVGVAPAGYSFPNEAQLWLPHRTDPEGCGRGCHAFVAIARLAPGATIAQASAELSRLAANLARDHPDTNAFKRMRPELLRDYMVGDVRNALWILLGAVGVVLLIACANVANLLLVRASSRRGEVAVRAALGASRSRLVTQVLVESMVLAGAGAAFGLGLAAAGVRVLRDIAPAALPRIDQVTVDASVLLFSLATAFVVALLFGLSPALRLAATPLVQSLRSESRGGQLPRESLSRGLLLAVEVGLSLVLLVGAGLLLRSLGELNEVQLGFDGREVVRFSLALPSTRYDELEEVAGFYRSVEERIATLPGVESVGSVFGAPMASGNIGGDVIWEGRPEPEPGREPSANVRPATPGYFQAMRLTLLRGRPIEATDRTGTLPVAVVNETFVRENLPGEDPLGKRFGVTVNFGFGQPTWTIVGVIRDVRRTLRAEPTAEVYVPQAQFGPSFMSVHVRGRPGTANLLPAIRDQVHAVDANVPLANPQSVTEAIRNDSAPTRFYLLLVSIFAGLAVALAAIGLYGVVSFLVSRRLREIGIRLALGAPRLQITRLVVRQAMLPAFLGVAGGLLAASALSRLMGTMLFQVDPMDPIVLVGVSALVLAISLAATLLPARRATRVDPVVVLRSD